MAVTIQHEPPKSPAWRSPSITRLVLLEKARHDRVRKGVFLKEQPFAKHAERPLNILAISQNDRSRLLAGRRFAIITDGNNVIRKNVPVRALMASFTKVHDLLQVKPSATQFHVRGNVQGACLECLLDIFTTKEGLEVGEIELVSGDFSKDALMYQACLALGIYSDHSRPLLNALRARISQAPLSFAELNTLIDRIPSHDPLFKYLAHDLCNRRLKKQIKDLHAFDWWLNGISRTTLKEVMTEIDSRNVRTRRTREGSDLIY
ncbi:hypothetical protein EK21DRAFT_111672 [Setomelanomma holmii]|uniref:Uncharacterized protein n=1 Tax=Setomelanomma holmii TaxID=210430 RepID=A0A9P4HAM9_9PLEO|nr:hypothetical protein EK21DRAFT_111672 [Setomelanomma holmii]